MTAHHCDGQKHKNKVFWYFSQDDVRAPPTQAFVNVYDIPNPPPPPPPFQKDYEAPARPPQDEKDPATVPRYSPDGRGGCGSVANPDVSKTSVFIEPDANIALATAVGGTDASTFVPYMMSFI